MQVDVKLHPDVWSVVADHLLKLGFEPTDEVKQLIEDTADIVLFDGGAFIAYDNEFDLFVVPERRGKWRIRSEITKFLEQMACKHSTIAVRINQNNSPSLRLAYHFGFTEVGREQINGEWFICLEK